jgi:hypothetical protein
VNRIVKNTPSVESESPRFLVVLAARQHELIDPT